ncbi:S-layer homology domain-containing protein [Paenibacillus luteus]|uniref:S-layer homology domain-containing protein n=1 Tax=Paenibacillus luteus TaxID=2545753 RepID=UPI00114205CC|nr:S-layer homology domain-containing protein [Paenibacillus luteus]
MKKGRKKLILLALLLLLFNSLGIVAPTASANSSASSLDLALPNDLTDWLLDEDAGYIYAISSPANSLYFIRLSDFKIEKTLNVGSRPLFLARDGQFLQIALSGATMIKTVDLSTQQISNTIVTPEIPNSIAASSTHLFYGTSDRKIYQYNKATKTSSVLNSDYNIFDNLTLAVDESSNTLYAGKLSSYGGITAIDIKTGVQLSKDISDNMEIGGSSISLKRIFIDDRYVYFGGHQFNKHNLIETTGTYSRTNNDYTYLEAVILDVTDAYVLTTQGVYDKATYTPLVLFPSNKRFALIDSSGHAYLSGIENWYDNINKITRIGLTIPQRTTVNLTGNSYFINSNQPITDWITSDNSPYIYAIVASTNELVVIRKEDLSVVKKMFIGSNPSAIKIYNDKVYVIFKGANHINVIDLDDGIPSEVAISQITTKNYPLNVYPDKNNRILYNGGTFGSGISVTSAVYTSVTDAVYNEKSTGIYYPSSYALDLDQQILFGGDSSNVYKYDSQDFRLLERKSIDNGYYYSNIILDENNLYYGKLRLDANQPSILLGTYSERIVYAHGSLVFSNAAVYDRDSFTKKYDLLMYVQNVYVGADHTIFVSTDNRLYKFKNIEEMQTVMNETRLPSNGVFVDEDLNPGWVDGYLSFEPPIDQDGIKGYAAYYLDQMGNKLMQIGLYKKVELSTDSLFVYDISGSGLPDKAVSIGVYPLIRLNDYSSERMLDVPLSVPIYDAPNYLPVDLTGTDTNADINIFSGTVTWKAGKTEIPNVRYHLYFIDAYGDVGDEIAVVDGGKNTYSVALEKSVPEEALGIGVFMESDNFISPFYSRILFEDKRTTAIPLTSITVNKFMVQADNIVVNNLIAGDIIRVYNETQTFIIGEGIVKPNQSTITITIGNIGNPGNKLVLTRESTNRFESTGTSVVIPSVINDSGGGGIPGGGGGTPGGGGIPGGIAGGSITEEAKIVTTMKQGTDGTYSSITEVPLAYISNAMSDPDFKKNPNINIKADEKTATQSSQFQIDLNTISNINNSSKDAVLTFESSSGKLQLPVNSLLSSASQDNRSGQKVVITIAQASSDFKTKLSTQLNSSTSVPLGVPLEFEVKLTGNGQDKILSNFSNYVGHIMDLKLSKDADAVYAGLTYDPITQAYVPVPTTWEWKDGILQVTLQRKGNSVYTVVQNHVEFNDLDNSSPYKESILALANRMVINGYPDGSFKAESVVTRAEFAAMLNRALGILPRLQASKSFKDVKTGTWYAAQVNAAVDAGLINGYTDGTFHPNQEITHQEMIVMLVNAVKYSEAKIVIKNTTSIEFPDKLPDWAKPYYTAALDNGILTTDSPFQFQTGKNTQRQESALLLYQLMKVLKLINA